MSTPVRFLSVPALAALVLSLGGSAVRAQDAPEDLTTRALALLKSRCYQCHGVENYEPGLDVMDHTALVADRGERKTRFVLPGKPAESKIWQVIDAGTMPQGSPQFNAEEKATIREWIEAGATFPVAKVAERPFLSNIAILRAIHEHLLRSRKEDRPFLRYLSLAHLHNQRAAVSDQELRLSRAALSKALNSLSRSADIVLPKAIDTHGALFVIDLRRFGWTAAQWNKVLTEYPYGLQPRDVDESSIHGEISDLYGIEFDGVTHVRGDWFAVTASRPPLYHDLLGLPATLAELDKQLGVDRIRDFKENRLYRGAVQVSGVSAQNRVVDYHASDRGAYWISYDFDRNSGRGNVARFPLGPAFDGNDFADQAFQHAGSEIVFTLPNRLYGYFLVDDKGGRINVGPISIVHDQARTSGTPEIVNGLSCIACHKHGLRDFTDVIGNSHGLQNPDARRKAKQLYDANELQTRLVQARGEFLRTLDAATGTFLKDGDDKDRTIEQFPEPISTLAKHYDRDLTLNAAAAELGIEDAATLKANLQVVTLRSLGLGPLERGETIKRSMWSAREGRKSPFQETAQALNIGQAVVPLNQGN